MREKPQSFGRAARLITAVGLLATLAGCVVYAPPYHPYWHPYRYYYYP